MKEVGQRWNLSNWTIRVKDSPGIRVMKGVGQHWNRSIQTIKAKDSPSTHFQLVQVIVTTSARDNHVTSLALVLE